jgi:hypothetical protein
VAPSVVILPPMPCNDQLTGTRRTIREDSLTLTAGTNPISEFELGQKKIFFLVRYIHLFSSSAINFLGVKFLDCGSGTKLEINIYLCALLVFAELLRVTTTMV